MKTALIALFLGVIFGIISAQNTVSIEFSGVERNGGNVYVSLFNSEKSFKEKQVYLKFETQPSSENFQKEISLPNGEYIFSAYQDHNGNGKLDANIIGIPKEKFAFSNYDAKIPPGGFSRHKVAINHTETRVKLQFYKL
jgi:uncharacterized protein (DUF2141 family)